MLVGMADGATRTVIHIEKRVVAPADDAVPNRQLPAAVDALLADRTLVAAELACGLG